MVDNGKKGWYIMATLKDKKSKAVDEETRRVAANFKRLRKTRGWTQWDVAKQGEVSYQHIGHIEQCVRRPGHTIKILPKW
jgi:DNA-binding XRE family transcriptional regulator